MNNIFCGKITSSSYYRVAGWAATLKSHNFLAFFQYGWSPDPMNGTINTSATHQAGVSSIYDSINFKRGDIIQDYLNSTGQVNWICVNNKVRRKGHLLYDLQLTICNF